MSVTVRTINQTMSGPIDEDVVHGDGTSIYSDDDSELVVEAGDEVIAIYATGRWTFAWVGAEKNAPPS